MLFRIGDIERQVYAHAMSGHLMAQAIKGIQQNAQTTEGVPEALKGSVQSVGWCSRTFVAR